MTLKELIKCKGCGKKYPVNYSKNPHRESVKCPFCGTTWKFGKLFDIEFNKEYNRTHSKPFTLERMREAITRLYKRDVTMKVQEDQLKKLKEEEKANKKSEKECQTQKK